MKKTVEKIERTVYLSEDGGIFGEEYDYQLYEAATYINANVVMLDYHRAPLTLTKHNEYNEAPYAYYIKIPDDKKALDCLNTVYKHIGIMLPSHKGNYKYSDAVDAWIDIDAEIDEDMNILKIFSEAEK